MCNFIAFNLNDDQMIRAIGYGKLQISIKMKKHFGEFTMLAKDLINF